MNDNDDHIKRLMTLTSDNIKRLSLYYRCNVFRGLPAQPIFTTNINLTFDTVKICYNKLYNVTEIRSLYRDIDIAMTELKSSLTLSPILSVKMRLNYWVAVLIS